MTQADMGERMCLRQLGRPPEWWGGYVDCALTVVDERDVQEQQLTPRSQLNCRETARQPNLLKRGRRQESIRRKRRTVNCAYTTEVMALIARRSLVGEVPGLPAFAGAMDRRLLIRRHPRGQV